MRRYDRNSFGYAFAVAACLLAFCTQKIEESALPPSQPDCVVTETVRQYVRFEHNVPMRKYFFVIDTIIKNHRPLLQSPLGEYCLINHNSRIIDSLMSFDYYHQKKLGNFVFNLSEKTIFHRGDSLAIPDSATCASIVTELTLYAIDVNIPEFKLTLFKNGVPVYSCPVRVGRNAIEYMETVKTNVDLKTPIGTGKIVRTYRSPRFTDPHTGLTYLTTVRDDGARTLMPEIPSIQPFINGVSTGKIIHATTNQITLGKAYSHGCIGLTESDMWWVYYHAPIGTPVRFRYQLQVLNENGDTIQLKDIYGLRKHAN